jgi:hypothetical protein
MDRSLYRLSSGSTRVTVGVPTYENSRNALSCSTARIVL